MKVTFRTLNGEIYSFEVDPNLTIDEFNISSKIPNISSNSRYIYKGENLEKTVPFVSLNMEPDDFIVVFNPTNYETHPRQPPNSSEFFLDVNGKTQLSNIANKPSNQPLPNLSSNNNYPYFYNNTQVVAMSERLNPDDLQQILRKELENFMENEHSNNEEAIFNEGNIDISVDESNNLTAEDKQAIDRLEELTRMNRNLVCRVYILCNKEENEAANLLLSMNNS